MVTIPNFVLQSQAFSTRELKQLESVNELPSEQEIDSFQYLPEIQELLNSFIGDQNTRRTHQFLKAKDYLEKGEIKNAWKIILI